MEKKKYEVLSPAGDLECLISAVNFGADAVYLAGEQFGMRTASKNFNDEKLSRRAMALGENPFEVYNKYGRF